MKWSDLASDWLKYWAEEVGLHRWTAIFQFIADEGKMKTEHAHTTTIHNKDQVFTLRICGRVEAPLEVDIDILKAMDTIEAKDLRLICGSGEPRGRISHCRGALLSDLINMADVVIEDHNDTKKMYIVAASADGYKAVFSWQEIFNSPVGEGVMVVVEKDGRQLYEEDNSVDLLSSCDYLTGPRYVRRLGSIEIVMVTEELSVTPA